jgi:hypothetical protein
MKRSPQATFEKRVYVALGWATLIGLIACMNLVPEMQQGGTLIQSESASPLIITEHAMVLPPAPAALPPRAAPYVSVPANSAVPQRRTTSGQAPAPRLAHLPQKQRVQQWFTHFDRIRREAQMSPAEKATAIRLWATSFVTTGPQDTSDAEQLLSSMVLRYEKAATELERLDRIPETRTLQQGYLTFFRKAHGNFKQYVTVLNKQSTRHAIDQMQQGRKQLAVIDVRNKNLDRKIRRQYGIAELD